MDEHTYPAAMDEAARQAWERAAIEEARAQVARGEVVTLEAVEAWIESWDTEHELPMPQPALPLQPARD